MRARVYVIYITYRNVRYKVYLQSNDTVLTYMQNRIVNQWQSINRYYAIESVQSYTQCSSSTKIS